MSEEEIVDAVVVDTPPEGGPPPSVAVARRERRSEVIRPLDLDEVVESFHAYQEMLPKLLVPSDYQEIGQGKRFPKKSAWRKIATAFDLDVQMIRSVVERDERGAPTRAEVWARAVAPSGRSMDGDGYCSVDEERFSGPRGNKSKLENDLRATATTRAMNRAISGLVGMGDVSAEEADAGAGGTPAFAEKYTGSPQDVGTALAVLVGAENVPAVVQPVLDAAGYMPQIVADAIFAAAATKGHFVAPELG